MRYLGILLLAASPLWAQPAENDPRILQTLLSEVQQLRLAVERSTLLGTRTQLAISQLQLQEAKAERLSRELTSLCDETSRLVSQKARRKPAMKEAEAARTQIQKPR